MTENGRLKCGVCGEKGDLVITLFSKTKHKPLVYCVNCLLASITMAKTAAIVIAMVEKKEQGSREDMNG